MQSALDGRLNRSSYNQDGDAPQPHGGPQKKHHRQRMSCHQCRLRKIRCDRIYPCAACCSRGKPKDCVYPADANNKAIEQSQEIKSLRQQVHDLQSEISELHSSKGEGELRYPCSQPATQSRHPPNKRTPNGLGQGVSYGTPSSSSSMRNISDVECFPEFDQRDNKDKRRVLSLAYPVPRKVDVLAYQDAAADPFPSLWDSSLGVEKILHVLPPYKDILFYLDAFQEHFRSFYSCQMSTDDFRHFLTDLSGNSEKNPQMLAFLFVALARGTPFGVFKKHGKWIEGTMEGELTKADVYIAAAMHALRLSSFMNRPTLLCIQTLLMMGPYLVNVGKFLDAYTLFGVTIRVAHGMGLYQNPEDITPQPSAKESHLRQSIWWRTLFLDQYYSTTLGRPLGISIMGDMSLQSSYMRKTFSPPYISRLDTYTTKFTALSRQIVSCSHLTNPEIDKFTDSLLELQGILPPEERFDQSWLHSNTELPRWPSNLYATTIHSNMHNYLILLNRRRQESNYSKKSPQSGIHATPERVSERKGYSRVISSCHEVLSAFTLLHRRIPIGLSYWENGQQAFNAAMILGLNILETGDFTDLPAVVTARDIFGEMQAKGICRPAKLAVSRLNVVLEATRVNGPTMDEKVMGNHGMILTEDPEIRGAVGEPYTPVVFRSGDNEQLRRNMDRSRLDVVSPKAQYSNSDRQDKIKVEKNDRGEGVGVIPRYQSSPEFKEEPVNDIPALTDYNKSPQMTMPFPSTIVGRDGNRQPYNTGIQDPRRMIRMGPYGQEPSSIPTTSTLGGHIGLPFVYSDGGPPQHYQPRSHPVSTQGPLGYAFSNHP